MLRSLVGSEMCIRDSSSCMKILILEDEIPAYEKLLSYLEKVWPDANIVAWGRSIVEAKHFLAKHQDLDLIFSDIELLDGVSFNAFEDVKIKCPIIFCTAYDQYLFKAFQTNGIAYLIKPYDRENFNEAIKKYQSLFKTPKAAISQNVILDLKEMLQEGKKSYKKRFSIKKKGGIKLLGTDDIAYFEANGDFCFAYDAKNEKHVVNYPLGDIANKVDPKKFFRINRSEMINIEFIDKIESHFKNKLLIKLVNMNQDLYTSSSKTKEFRIWVEK